MSFESVYSTEFWWHRIACICAILTRYLVLTWWSRSHGSLWISGFFPSYVNTSLGWQCSLVLLSVIHIYFANIYTLFCLYSENRRTPNVEATSHACQSKFSCDFIQFWHKKASMNIKSQKETLFSWKGLGSRWQLNCK